MIKFSGGHEKFNFPCGETHVKVGKYPEWNEIHWEYENDSEIMEYLLLADTVKRNFGEFNLFLPYVPFSRQDRINSVGECFSLKVFCDLINQSKPRRVTIIDPHSDVTTALLNNVVVVTQENIFKHYFRPEWKNFYLISPDAGALKKIHKFAKAMNPLDIIEASKVRNTETGEITGTKLTWDVSQEWPYASDIEGHVFVIVDDICDGGKTFTEIAKQLKYWYPHNKIILMVTHGFFTKGLEVFDGLIDEIYTLKGKVK